jgi:hypothetical protein
MKRNQFARIVACALAALSVSAVAVSSAGAHERREVGNYNFVVGFRVEPAFQNEINGIDLRVTLKDAAATPVENLQDALEVTVSAGGKSMPTKLRAVFRDPGHYYSDFIPTAAGDYTFQIKGKINGQTVEEKFISGPGRFGAVESVEALQFPLKTAQPDLIAVQLAQAQGLGIAGALFGALGMGLGGLALAQNRKRSGPKTS